MHLHCLPCFPTQKFRTSPCPLYRQKEQGSIVPESNYICLTLTLFVVWGVVLFVCFFCIRLVMNIFIDLNSSKFKKWRKISQLFWFKTLSWTFKLPHFSDNLMTLIFWMYPSFLSLCAHTALFTSNLNSEAFQWKYLTLQMHSSLLKNFPIT